ncbi:hypothetical protein K466DRAFT_274379 [Polyporus arcularius HHB13444]|uniref:Uncharacterized protein n=1 Tax=Polyporus arcularius HHB13444 TaxID=1314778 RepID=A0A5C3PR83_9APHY|nr:hypothetical protein K466DRAFT_274379 [Polyporus arcularius HHB13444]
MPVKPHRLRRAIASRSCSIYLIHVPGCPACIFVQIGKPRALWRSRLYPHQFRTNFLLVLARVRSHQCGTSLWWMQYLANRADHPKSDRKNSPEDADCAPFKVGDGCTAWMDHEQRIWQVPPSSSKKVVSSRRLEATHQLTISIASFSLPCALCNGGHYLMEVLAVETVPSISDAFKAGPVMVFASESHRSGTRQVAPCLPDAIFNRRRSMSRSPASQPHPDAQTEGGPRAALHSRLFCNKARCLGHDRRPPKSVVALRNAPNSSEPPDITCPSSLGLNWRRGPRERTNATQQCTVCPFSMSAASDLLQ